jgi:hypothetical protein
MNKMLKEMTEKVAMVQESYHEVLDFVDKIEETVASGKDAFSELEEQMANHQEALTMAQDLGEAKLIKQQIDALAEDMELLQSVNKAKELSMMTTLSDKAEQSLLANKNAVELFRALDKEMVANTSLAQLKSHIELMSGFASALNNSFASVRNILLDTKIVAHENQNRQYRGIHLGRAGVQSELTNFEYHVRPYIQKVKQAGVSL